MDRTNFNHTFNNGNNKHNGALKLSLFIPKPLIISCLLVVVFLYSYTSTFAQKVRWPIEVEGSKYGIGAPTIKEYGYNENGICTTKEAKKAVKKIKKKPAIIHFKYSPFSASQIVITETFNPGAISKVEIGALTRKNKLNRQTVWTKTSDTIADARYTVRNFHFTRNERITDVWVHIDYSKVAGINQLGGVGLVDSETNYPAIVNVPSEELFSGKQIKLNDDISGKKNPKGLTLSVDGDNIYFSNNDDGLDKIYCGKLNPEKELVSVKFSDFNLPERIAISSGIIGISQDNNTAYIANMDKNKFKFYDVSQRKTKSDKTKWVRTLNTIPKYYNGGIFLDFIISYDSRVIIAGYKEKSKQGTLYNEDLFFSIKDDKGQWSPFLNMGLDLNTIGSEIPCYLAPDNKTLYFSSNGNIGYGLGDIYVSKRQDETWTSWSTPINLGPIINSPDHENSFIIDNISKTVYFIRWDKNLESDIYSINYAGNKDDRKRLNIELNNDKPKNTIVLQQKNLDNLLPDPIMLIKGQTIDKKNDTPIQSDIFYYDIFSGTLIGKAVSNAETGEFTLALRKGFFYSLESKKDGYYSENMNFDTRNISENEQVKLDFHLKPIELNSTIRLNNIFFDTDQATLLPASFFELDNLTKLLTENKEMIIEIGGHTDDVGSDEYNQQLSKRRAETVVNYLINKGITTERLSSKGYGESKPYVENNSEDNRALNRRVEFTIMKVE